MSMMGFKKIDKLPDRKRRGVYDNVLETVAKTGDMYALDTHDIKRVVSLRVTLKNRARKLGLPVKILQRGTTVIIVHATPVVSERTEVEGDD